MEKVSIKELSKVDLRVGEIKAIKIHPKADKLYILMVDLGEGEHELQLVAGLKEHYKENELIGKKVIVVRNLEHAVIRGVESQGMVLAAVYKDKVKLITVDKDMKVGAKVQ